jgi:hypothetical protein
MKQDGVVERGVGRDEDAWLKETRGKKANMSVCSIWRSTLILSFASCYLMWGTSLHFNNACVSDGTDCSAAITFLAQWHPLIEPKRKDMRPGHAP